MSSNDDLVDFTFSRRCPKNILALEEREREERISAGANPILLGKIYRMQNEFIHQGFTYPHTFSLNAPYTLKLSEKAAIARDIVVEKAHTLSDFTSNSLSNLAGKAHQYYDAAKDKLGLYDVGSIAAVSKAEEAERARRIELKVDPMVQAKRHQVEAELLKTVKTV